MHLGEISFCDKIGFNIKSDEVKKKILLDLEAHCNFKVIQKHYEKFGEHQIPILTKNPHLISLRTNGNPYLLYLTKYNNVNQCIFIDKKIQQGYFYPRMIIVKLWFHDILFTNTLFDGEMVKANNGEWIYIINDMLVESSQLNANINLVKRLNRIYDILTKMYRKDELDVCHIQVKKYFHYHEYNMMISEFQKDLPYSCRGMYFKPLFFKFKDILYNFDESLIKKVIRTKYKTESNAFLLNKSMDDKDMIASTNATLTRTSSTSSGSTATSMTPRPDTTSVVLKHLYIQKTNQPDVYEVYETPTSSASLGLAFVNNINTSKMLRMIFMHTTPTEKKKMECKYNTKFNKWMPISQA